MVKKGGGVGERVEERKKKGEKGEQKNNPSSFFWKKVDTDKT